MLAMFIEGEILWLSNFLKKVIGFLKAPWKEFFNSKDIQGASE